MLQLANKVALGKATQKDLSDLARMGLNAEDAGRIAAAPQTKMGKLLLANTDAWDDPYLIEAFTNGLVKTVDSIIITPGAADIPIAVKGPWRKLVVQFMSFSMASHNRALVPLLQDPDMARKISGMSSALVVGAMVHAVREHQAGRGDKLQKAIADGDFYTLARGTAHNVAALSTFMLADQYIGGAFGLEGGGRYASASTLEGLLGPTAGAVVSGYRIGGAIGPKEFTESTLDTLRGLTPFMNTPQANLLLNEDWLGIPALGLKERIVKGLDLKERPE
jgi:hypothetical protein